MIAGRVYMRAQTVGDIAREQAERAVELGATSPEEIEAIYRLTSLAGFEERFVIPPMYREQALELVQITQDDQAGGGAGFLHAPQRGL